MEIKLKLLVHRMSNKVVVAECGSDFIEVLFSLLTVPLGIVVKALDKNSGLGCIDNLYRTVEDLDSKYLQTEACKEMLLQPRSGMSQHCEDVLVKMQFLEPTKIFKCGNTHRREYNCQLMSLFKSCVCSCSRPMDVVQEVEVRRKSCPIISGTGRTFFVLDDLHIVQASSDAIFPLLENYGIDDASVLEETTVELNNIDQFLLLLKRSLHSETPLTDIFLRQGAACIDAENPAIYNSIRDIKLEESDVATQTGHVSTSESEGIKVETFESKSTGKLVYMESDNEFADLLFSFLTLPLGLILFFIGDESFSLGCLGNVYSSVNGLGEIILAESKQMLLKPKLAYHFVCNKTVLKLDEADDLRYYPLNPKLAMPNSSKAREKGGGYATTTSNFIITRNMTVKPFSFSQSFQSVKDEGASIGDLRRRSIIIGEAEALKLLKCCLISTKLPDSMIL